jgi:hypothetical protein
MDLRLRHLLVVIPISATLAACGGGAGADPNPTGLASIQSTTAPAAPPAIALTNPTPTRVPTPAPTKPPATGTSSKPAPSPTPVPTKSPQLSPVAAESTLPPGWVALSSNKTYRDPENRFTIEYPQTWGMSTQRGLVLTSSDDSAWLKVAVVDVGGLQTERQLVDQATERFRDEFGSDYVEDERVTLANGRIRIDFTIREATRFSGQILIDYRRTTMFVLTTQAPTQRSDRYQDDFNDMISSYTINS